MKSGGEKLRFDGCRARCLSGTNEQLSSTCDLPCAIANSMLSRVIISLAMTAALLAAPVGLSARSCILSSAPAQQGCKPRCCANKTCCATSKEHKSNPSHPLGKADSNYKVSATCIAVPSALLPSSESVAQLFARCTAAFNAHSPPTLALICIRLI